MNSQREVVYRRRRELLQGADFSEQALEFAADVIESTVHAYASAEVLPEEWDWEGLETAISQLYPSELAKSFDQEAASYEDVLEKHLSEGLDYYHKREAEVGEERFRELERLVFLNVLDNKWREHLYEMDYLREGIGLRAYGQRDPLIEYQREALDMFSAMQEGIKEEFVRYMFHIEVAAEREAPALHGVESHDGAAAALGGSAAEADGAASGEPIRSDKVPRNAPCPCGSGRKYKKCHGANL
jgi:preprotein translocase subunit SecA